MTTKQCGIIEGAKMIRKDDAKDQILSEWPQWWIENRGEKEHATGTDGFVFFGYLQSNKAHLLEFRNSGDKWQTVHGWLIRARLLGN